MTSNQTDDQKASELPHDIVDKISDHLRKDTAHSDIFHRSRQPKYRTLPDSVEICFHQRRIRPRPGICRLSLKKGK
jgi:hypothetical protein